MNSASTPPSSLPPPCLPSLASPLPTPLPPLPPLPAPPSADPLTFRRLSAHLAARLLAERAAAAGTPVGSPYDFATPYLKGILGFIGLTPVVVGGATSNPPDKAAESKAAAEALIDAVAL